VPGLRNPPARTVTRIDPHLANQVLRRHRTHLVSTHPSGRRLEDCTGNAFGGDASFSVPETETLAQVLAEYAAACATSDEIAAWLARYLP
jgi:Protein of unknown function (DUF664)